MPLPANDLWEGDYSQETLAVQSISGNANLSPAAGGLHNAIQGNGVPGRHYRVIVRPSRSHGL